MEQIILDTNFLIIAVKNKIDLFESLKEKYGVFEVLIPDLVIQELEKIKNSKQKLTDRQAAEIVLEVISKNKVKIINLEKKEADSGIVCYIKNKKDIYVATLDRELKNKIKRANKHARFLTIKQKNQIAEN
ncbi:MAG: PIN domain-containing protein [Candidatus Pacearchaeota archaeon]